MGIAPLDWSAGLKDRHRTSIVAARRPYFDGIQLRDADRAD